MNSKNINKTISIISKITKNKSKRLHEPNFCGQEIKFLSESIRNKSVSTYGEETDKFDGRPILGLTPNHRNLSSKEVEPRKLKTQKIKKTSKVIE